MGIKLIGYDNHDDGDRRGFYAMVWFPPGPGREAYETFCEINEADGESEDGFEAFLKFYEDVDGGGVEPMQALDNLVYILGELPDPRVPDLALRAYRRGARALDEYEALPPRTSEIAVSSVS